MAQPLAHAPRGPRMGEHLHPVVDGKRLVPEFQCRVPFRLGVRQSITSLREHPDQQNLNPKVDALCDEVVSAWRARSS